VGVGPSKVTATDPAYQLTLLGVGDITNTLSGVTEIANPKGDGKVRPRSVPTDARRRIPLIRISISVDVAEVPSQCPLTNYQIGGIVPVTLIGILDSTHSSRGL
jgi:hypothetical protein